MMASVIRNATLALATSCLLSGCISYHSATDAGRADIPHVSFLDRITLGETQSDWLVAQFGQPSAVRQPMGEAHIWQYENVLMHSKRFRALPLFAMELKGAKRTVFNFEIENDRIVRYWQEEA